MVSEVTFNEHSTSSSSSIVATNLNLGSVNLANLNTSLYPIVAGSYSFDKYFKLNFGGTFTSISDVIFYKSDGDYVTGEVLNYTGQVTTWVTPTGLVSGNATTAIPTSLPASANVSIGGSLSGSLTAVGTTDFIVLQGSYTPNTSSGGVNEKTMSFAWTET